MDNFKELINSVKSGEFTTFCNIIGNRLSSEDKKLKLFNSLRDKFNKHPMEILMDDNIEGGLSDNMSIKDIVLKHNNDKFNDDLYNKIKNQLKKGIKIEFEHTNDINIAKEIAIDHLMELPDYYDKLETIEEEFKSKKQQKYFYWKANQSKGKEKEKWKKMADEFSKETDYSELPEKVNENTSDDIKYGYLMLELNLPKWDILLSKIKKEDLYKSNEGYGLEDEPHITILYGFHDNINIDQIKKILKQIKKPIKFKIIGVSLFENEEFDVLKFDVESKQLNNLNKIFKKFPHTNEYDDYIPHITIAYLNKGKGDEYLKNIELKDPIIGESTEFIFSTKNKEKTKYRIDERIVTYMDGASSVEVKDECKIGGGKICNQGDINALNIKKLNKNK